ncbi:MAG: rRNA maturation RNase YbeY [Minisyncoccia bacterium]
MEGAVSIQNLTRRKSVPRFAYDDVAKSVLPNWSISLAFVGPAKARRLNEKLRDKTYTPNVLSYEVGKRSGEIIICPSEAEKQAPQYGLSGRDFVLYLFIHGLLHLKGWAHGATMEQCERKLVAKFAASDARALTHVTTHSNRNRHRDVPSENGRHRGTHR